MNRYGLRDYFRFSQLEDHLVILKINRETHANIGFQIEGVMEIIVRKRHIFIEKLVRNSVINIEGRVGFWLMAIAENIALWLRKPKIQLYSLEQVVPWYSDLGYQPYGTAKDDDEFGTLVPMEKTL